MRRPTLFDNKQDIKMINRTLTRNNLWFIIRDVLKPLILLKENKQ